MKTVINTRSLSKIFYTIGIVATIVLAVVAMWPDYEASLFQPTAFVDEAMTSLRCPLVITPQDSAEITASFDNPLDKEVRITVRSSISTGDILAVRREDQRITLAPGERLTLRWPVSADDTAYPMLSMARIYQFRAASLPSRDQSCGIFIMRLPVVTGAQVVAALAGASVLGLGLSAVLWRREARGSEVDTPGRDPTVGFVALAGLALAVLIASVSGLWGIGVVGLVLSLLLAAALLERVLR